MRCPLCVAQFHPRQIPLHPALKPPYPIRETFVKSVASRHKFTGSGRHGWITILVSGLVLLIPSRAGVLTLQAADRSRSADLLLI
jgi:hypothetical protein